MSDDKKFEPANAATVGLVLDRYAEWLVGKPSEVRWEAARAINLHLNAMLRNDAFGTEGQDDPRGDHRG
jgi:hypothetical protein